MYKAALNCDPVDMSISVHVIHDRHVGHCAHGCGDDRERSHDGGH